MQIAIIDDAVSSHLKGRFAVVTNAGRDAVDAEASGACGSQGGFPVSGFERVSTSGADADGEVVWFWRPMVGVKL